MNRLFEDVQTSLFKLATACRDLGMFCVLRVLKVTDWVMCGIFAYWPSSSVIVNQELKCPLIQCPLLCALYLRFWRNMRWHRLKRFCRKVFLHDLRSSEITRDKIHTWWILQYGSCEIKLRCPEISILRLTDETSLVSNYFPKFFLLKAHFMPIDLHIEGHRV